MATKTIIIDHGSGFLKAGLSGWNQPQLICPSVVNYIPCRENPGPSYAHRQHYREDHEDCPVILTEFPLKEPATRKKTLEIMFELQEVPSLLLADQLEMSLYASGCLTGVVIDSGFGLTRMQPFLLGQPLPDSQRAVEFAGQDLSTYLFKSIFKERSDEHNLYQMDTVATTQMSKCYVPTNLEEALEFHQNLPSGSDESNTYQLPDGTRVELAPLERLAPEMFFSPQVFGLQGPSISQVLVDSIKSCEVPGQPMLLSHVVPCGGNSLYPGFTKRLWMELNSGHFPFKATVWMGEKRHFSVWLGASVVAHLSTYKSQWVARQEYLESMRL